MLVTSLARLQSSARLRTSAAVVDGQKLEEILASMGEGVSGLVSDLLGGFGQLLPLPARPRIELHVQLGPEITKTVARKSTHHLLRLLPETDCDVTF